MDENEFKEKMADIRKTIADEVTFEMLEWFRNYARQLDAKYPNPTVEEKGWLGNIWDMIHMAGKEEWKSRNMPSELCSEENPCCDRRNEYNGFASGPLSFVCPKHCSCHD